MDNPSLYSRRKSNEVLYSRRNGMDNESGLGILSAVLDTMSFPNRVVSNRDEVVDPLSLRSSNIDVKDLHKLLMKGCYYQRDRELGHNNCEGSSKTRSPSSSCHSNSLQDIQIFIVKLWSTTGKNIAINIKPTATVRQLKELLFLKEDIPPVHQRLIYAGKQLPDDGCDDGQTLQDFGIVKESNLQLLLRLRGGGSSATGPNVWRSCRSIVLTPDLFDERYHHDFTYVCDKGFNFYRGGVIYIRPCGWSRFALKVEGEYTDDVWLKGNQGKRLDPYTSVDGEWPCKRSKHGYGIYSTPDIDCALKFAECATSNGRSYKLVIQNRINPDSLIKISSSQTRGGEYWKSVSEQDVRPYAICIRECVNQLFCY
uniref:Ubiquitin-like domain-containing protein n=1 Tax=Daphnia galeata TaxID=27404 RepID=A0A8J2WN43_9CRUS|nr:unnamed protein product [Daphnia galeata]